MNNNTVNLPYLCQQVQNLVLQVAQFIREQAGQVRQQDIETKQRNHLVSYVDKTAEELITSKLKEILPQAGFIVEENTRNERSDYNWIVDPLDGTTNFVHGIPCYAVSIALECKGDILVGVVYEVSRDECFYATKGEGAFLNESRIQVSLQKSLSESLIATGFPIYNFTRFDSFIKTLEYFMRHTHGVRRMGAAAVDLCYLACGRVDGFFEYNLNAWDVAAGALIVKEAGGRVFDFKGGNNWLFGKEVACSNALLEQEFQSIIQSSFV